MKLQRRISFAVGFLVSLLIYRQVGVDIYRPLALVMLVVTGFLYVLSWLQKEWAPHEAWARYFTFPFAAGFVVAAISTLFAWILWSLMGKH